MLFVYIKEVKILNKHGQIFIYLSNTRVSVLGGYIYICMSYVYIYIVFSHMYHTIFGRKGRIIDISLVLVWWLYCLKGICRMPQNLFYKYNVLSLPHEGSGRCLVQVTCTRNELINFHLHLLLSLFWIVCHTIKCWFYFFVVFVFFIYFLLFLEKQSPLQLR